jgi:hypothetical protein
MALFAMRQALQRASDTGIAAIGVRNNNHIGMLAYYAEYAARLGSVAIVLTTSEALVTPFGGAEALIGTNPIAIGFPAGPEPFVLDMATSATAMGKVIDRKHRGEPLPGGWAVAADGRPTTDASAALLGALLPFGGAKGYGLGLAVEHPMRQVQANGATTDLERLRAPRPVARCANAEPHQLGALRPDTIQKMYAEKLTEPTESGKPLTAISVKKLTEVLHNALETAVKWGYLARNPADQVVKPAVPRRTLPALGPEELNRLIQRAIAEGERDDVPTQTRRAATPAVDAAQNDHGVAAPAPPRP